MPCDLDEEKPASPKRAVPPRPTTPEEQGEVGHGGRVAPGPELWQEQTTSLTFLSRR